MREHVRNPQPSIDNRNWNSVRGGETIPLTEKQVQLRELQSELRRAIDALRLYGPIRSNEEQAMDPTGTLPGNDSERKNAKFALDTTRVDAYEIMSFRAAMEKVEGILAQIEKVDDQPDEPMDERIKQLFPTKNLDR